ncbi:MAG TPA: hypothetical protein PLO89_00350 [Spirochaetota bacterium]|nr:hypothetical protein [Spirochaetota bacterium]
MRRKFSFLSFLLFSFFSLYANDEQRSVAFFINKAGFSQNRILTVENFVDNLKSYILSKENEIYSVFITEDIDASDLKNVSSYVFLNRIDAYVWINPKISENLPTDEINLKLFSSPQELLFETDFLVEKKLYAQNDFNEKFINIGDEICARILNIKNVVKKNFSSNIKFNFKRDYPVTNIALFALSLKLYFDGRTSLKLFSFFPVELRLTFYPLKYFETGAFVKFDYNNMIYKYKNDGGIFQYFDSVFNLSYGLFLGFSYFNENFHYSVGLQFYNIYYSLDKTEFVKPDKIGGYFLPQFSLYNKIDIKIIKSINYSVFINLKTLPLFQTEKNLFYSTPFNYDFVVLEFSFVGFSFTF